MYQIIANSPWFGNEIITSVDSEDEAKRLAKHYNMLYNDFATITILINKKRGNK